MRTRLYWSLLVIGLTACGSVENIDDNNNNNDDGGPTCELIECNGDCCDAGEVCLSGSCEVFRDTVTARFETTPRDPTGWLDAENNPITFAIEPVDAVGVVYECRTGPESLLGGIPFTPCDGGDGTQPVHEAVPMVNMEEGSYRTEVRVRVGDLISAPAGFDYYAHHSLDGAATCPQPLTDEQIFEAAGPALLFGEPPPFPSFTGTRNPFISLPFSNVAPNAATQVAGSRWLGITGNNFTVETRSLRRRFALSPDRKLLLVQRQYVSRRAVDRGVTNIGGLCRNGISYRTSTSPRGDSKLDCQTMVLNSRGFSRCIRNDNGTPLVELPTQNGFIKLSRRMTFSAKGPTEVCPSNDYNPGACDFGYLVLPP